MLAVDRSPAQIAPFLCLIPPFRETLCTSVDLVIGGSSYAGSCYRVKTSERNDLHQLLYSPERMRQGGRWDTVK